MKRRRRGALLIALVGAIGCARAAQDSAPSAQMPVTPAPSSPSSAPVAPVESVAEAPDAAASAAPTPAFASTATPRHPNDLGWLSELVRTLADRPVTRDDVLAFLGKDKGPSPTDSNRRAVAPYSPYLTRVEVYALPHVDIEVAVELEFAENAQPNRSAVEQAVGPLSSVPRSPDDFRSGPRLKHYRQGAAGTARVFVELDKQSGTRITRVKVDVE